MRLPLLIALLLTNLIAACAAPPSPTPAPVTPSPTVIVLNEVMFTELGVQLLLPDGWQSRVESGALRIAPNAAALAAGVIDAPVIVLDTTPLAALTAQYGPAAANPETVFELASSAIQSAGYTISPTQAVQIGAAQGVAANLSSPASAGRLWVLVDEMRVVRVLAQAAAANWETEQPLIERIVASLEVLPLLTPTPTLVDVAAQPQIVRSGPPGFVLRLGGRSGPANSRFVAARGLAAAPDGTLYLAESGRGIWVFAPDGTLRTTFGADELLDAYDVALGPSGDLYVADYGRNAIVRFSAAGDFLGRWGGHGDAPDQFGLSAPQRIAVGADGSVYALDARPGPDGLAASSIVRFSAEGRLMERIALPPDLAPADLVVDRSGVIYLAESFAGAIVKLAPDGSVLARWGDPADPAQLAGPVLDIDRAGYLYLATYAGTILRLAPDGTIVARGGAPAAPGSIPNPGELSLPNGIVVAPGGVVWVSDNSGEYSAVTAFRLQTDAAALATAMALTPVAEAPPSETVQQWVASATASSFYAPDYDPSGVVGPPDVPECQDSPNAWAPATPGSRETLTVTFAEPVFATGLIIYQNYQPGYITLVELIDEQGTAKVVHRADPVPLSECPFALTITFEQTLTRIVGARITLDQRDGSWSEIDAVALIGVS
ncbi:NHL repeat-containing protein [uncultured Chloroflexus sp.]|uniref:NHL repeat-containing protein n=1 Tax=uncultured Chloroflexus sp. TaxID=214040 RepID=UPI00260CACEB|nr:NHL repeat-containing protein [uncultured Chloroflexus sp.]